MVNRNEGDAFFNKRLKELEKAGHKDAKRLTENDKLKIRQLQKDLYKVISIYDAENRKKRTRKR